MTTPATDLASTVLHTAGPMIAGLQRCRVCGVVLADETRITVRGHQPGHWAYAPGCRVLVLHGEDLVVKGPLRSTDELPPETHPCTVPTSETSTP